MSDLSEPERALQYFRQAMAMAETTTAIRVQAWILMGMSGPLASLGRPEEAIEVNRPCMELHQKMNSEMGMAQDLTSLADLTYQRTTLPGTNRRSASSDPAMRDERRSH